ncbi:uroporphyrinogen-III synthase/uroporphyrinogen III methyltransferase/synthase [Isoptericola jiangsuensis]|uniref:Uroporphyrinogen-III synthase/uroporphyrinogen III methyltransferase/synthase n=1 Tax=Isoptericola jiangsuensis TaxID=548579 RepID=A0A2A9F2J3_9MICO|nr:uroporphyrinogen-III synthase [Isoptericola jiangsuensis]PFG44675.1 uroporphyrinogen-III synthase/uroporphyrinogen III methyltransferase/synthase [Isoptericola jiangsuensis]
MTGPLTGRAVLLPRSPRRGAALAALLRDAGADVTVAPVIERAPALDGDALATAVRDVAAGRYAWTVITSVNAVDALAAAATDLDVTLAAAPTRWAAVGPATLRALRAIGIEPELVPDDASAAGMVAVFPPPAATTEVGGGVSRASSSDPEWRSRSDRERDVARDTPHPTGTDSGVTAATDVLLPLGDLATPVLRDGLVALGWTPHVVTAYRTVRSDLPRDVVARRFDVAVVTSGSVAREIADQLGTSTPVVAIGRPSAEVAREVGLTVAVVADRPTDAALAAAVTTALERNP